jgi:hypothetical protein
MGSASFFVWRSGSVEGESDAHLVMVSMTRPWEPFLA